MTPPRMTRLSPERARSSRPARAFVLLIICAITLLTIASPPVQADNKTRTRAERAFAKAISSRPKSCTASYWARTQAIRTRVWA